MLTQETSHNTDRNLRAILCFLTVPIGLALSGCNRSARAVQWTLPASLAGFELTRKPAQTELGPYVSY